MSPLQKAASLLAQGERNLLFLGPPRTGKSHAALDLAAQYLGMERKEVDNSPLVSRIQFHQGWGYGDFVSKLVPVSNKGALGFERQDGAFLRHCNENRNNKSVVIIDELNRANVAEVFGEAFQLIEGNYRGGGGLRIAGADDARLVVPVELLLVATANNIDRSTFPLDFALLSRFATISFEPDLSEVRAILERRPGWSTAQAEEFALLLGQIQRACQFPIGHAEFFNFGIPEDVPVWYQAKLRPLLQLHLTQHRRDDLDRVDNLIRDWSKDCSPQN